MKKKQNLLFVLLIFISVKTNAQWLPDFRLTNNPANSGTSPNNEWCVAASGNFVHVVWYDERDLNKEIYYKRSADEGVTWGSDIRLTNQISTSTNPSIAVSGQIVHVVWFDGRDGNYEIYHKRSVDNGVTWGPDTRLTNDINISEYPSMAVSGSAVHVVWHDDRDGDYEIYYKNSSDGGVTWGADTRLTDNPSYSSTPSVSVADSNLHVVWHDNRDGNIEIYYKRSTDGGLSWGADTRLTNDPEYSGDPSIAASGLNVHVVWSDQRDGFLINEIYYKNSTDGGITWGADTRLTFALNFASYPSVSVSDSNVHVVWNDVRDGWDFEVYYKYSSDGGLNWQPDTRLTNDTNLSEYPSVTVSNSVVHVVWADYRDGNPEIYYTRDPNGNPVGTEKLFKDNSFHIFPNPATDNFTLTFNSLPILSRNSFEIKIFNVLGENMYTDKLFTKSNIINCKSFPSGIYYVKVSDGEKMFVEKVIIQ